jgi:hypothetical protein
VDSLARIEGERLGNTPEYLGNLAAIFSPQRLENLEVRADFHFVGSRFVEGPQTRPQTGPAAMLPAYQYFNFGASVTIPRSGVRINADLQNAFQSKGLEEGNPRLLGVGVLPFFAARPLLPRRFLLGVSYNFGAGGGTTVEPAPGL